MKKEAIITYLNKLNESELIKIEGTEKERRIFKSREDVFNIFGSEEKGVLSPFNDYTYEWLNSFLYQVIDFLKVKDFDDYDEMEEAIRDVIYEWVDSETDIYTSDLTKWLADNNTNQYFLEEAIKENPQANNHIQLAQYKAIEELYNNALNCLMEDLKTEFPEEE